MPTSVLLAILAAAGLLALAPALVRRYDAGERIAAERASSTARVLSRRDKKTCAPEGEAESRTDDSSPGWQRAGRARAVSVRLTAQDSSRTVGDMDVADNERRTWWRRRHRRILIGMLAACILELAGVVFLGPGFWVGFGVVFAMMLWYIRYLRLRALASGRTVRGELTASTPHVPRQVSAVAESQPPQDPRWPDDPLPSLFLPEEKDTGETTGDDDDEPPTGPLSRPKGIRGRSYEAPPANV